MENLVALFQGKRVLVTGHTGFKGAWLSLWLYKLGAEVHGFALAENPSPATYSALGIRSIVKSEKIADITREGEFASYCQLISPDIVFHLAAQAIVRVSYRAPLSTLATNVMGTAYVLDALRLRGSPTACVVVTSDKCYENGVGGPYREEDQLGGHDIYSMSKSAAELLASSYRRSFFGTNAVPVRVATARAGNVIGGGDFSPDRILPDCVRALSRGERVQIRNPKSTRPWQHVLEPLSGYLELGAKLLEGEDVTEAFNFGPGSDVPLSVEGLVEQVLQEWGSGAWGTFGGGNGGQASLHEAAFLDLSIEKAATRLGWRPRWDVRRSIRETIHWYKSFENSAKTDGVMREISLAQIAAYEAAKGTRK